MKKLLIGLMLVSFMISAEAKKEEVGRYKVEVTSYTSNRTNKMYILETTIDTKTGKVIKRKRFYHANYGKKKHGQSIGKFTILHKELLFLTIFGFVITWQLGRRRYVQNTPTGCGNNFHTRQTQFQEIPNLTLFPTFKLFKEILQNTSLEWLPACPQGLFFLEKIFLNTYCLFCML